MRTHLDAAQVAAIIAEHYGLDEEDFSYMWEVTDEGVFDGITVIGEVL